MADCIVEHVREHFSEQIFVAHDPEITREIGRDRLALILSPGDVSVCYILEQSTHFNLGKTRLTSTCLDLSNTQER